MSKFDTKALMVSPHPDDAEIQAGGTIARWVKEGHRVVYVLCTSGDKGTDDPKMTPRRLAKMREKEQMDAARILGVSEVEFLRYHDGELEDTREFLGNLVHAIRFYRPEIVMAPDPYRTKFFQHRDHRMAGIAALDAVYPYSRDRLHFPEHEKEGLKPHKVAEIYFYGPDEPETFVDITDTMNLKIKSVLAHVCQMGNGRDVKKWMQQRAAETGKKAKVKYAEGFRRLVARR
ncbi:MAG: PIG-L deacetylase family protein [Dehalococcoidia bacterium]|nr:PIG-L deacetylase family protein [Dehalococcoidia bacterium]